jgi:hypothetical protein
MRGHILDVLVVAVICSIIAFRLGETYGCHHRALNRECVDHIIYKKWQENNYARATRGQLR